MLTEADVLKEALAAVERAFDAPKPPGPYDVPPPRRPCARGGCPNLQPCPAHPRVRWAGADDRRGTSAQRGYDARHRRWREVVLARDPLCVACLAAGRTRAATVADHVVPLRAWSRDPEAAARQLAAVLRARGVEADEGELHPWALANGQGLDRWCHQVKSSSDGERR
jgi:5-methylcytosine-specific restriction endonuclease McrA